MTYRIPKKIKIGGQVIPVKYHVKILEGKTGEAYGAYLNDKRELHILYGLKDETKKTTFIHECIHAMSDVYSIGLSEIQTAKMEMAIMDLVSNNKVDI